MVADIDECTVGMHLCSSLASCTNSIGSYQCACNRGYTGNGSSCSDANECDVCNRSSPCVSIANVDTPSSCLLNSGACDANAICCNTPSSFSCSCSTGFTGNGLVCLDVNECASSMSPCHVDADCHNNEGSFSCSCQEGFSGNGSSCHDVDECSNSSSHGCLAMHTCNNTHGSYLCLCRSGYKVVRAGAVREDCADIDECALDTDDCHAHAICTNRQGGYSCMCEPGFSGNGKICNGK